MKKLLSFNAIAILLFSLFSYGQMLQTITNTVTHGGVINGIGPLDFHVGGAGWTAGSALTPTLLNSGTLGNANHGGWAVNGTGITTANAVTGCDTGGAFRVNGTTTASGYTQKAIAVDNTGNSRNATVTIPSQTTGGFFRVTQAFCVNIGAANDGAGSSLFDLNRVVGIVGGDQYVVQLQNGTANNCGQFALNVEYINSTGTQHSPCIALSSLQTIKVDWIVDVSSTTADTGTATVKVYNTSNVQIGSTINITNGATNEQLSSACLGSCAAHGTSTGSNTFQNWSVKFTGKPVLLDPVNTALDPIYLVAVATGANHSSTNTTTLATSSVTLEEQAGDWVGGFCINENASGEATNFTNTAGSTFTKPAASKASGANGQSISFWYNFVSSGHTTQTYTCTWPTSNFSNIVALLFHGGTAFDVGAVLNQAAAVNITSGTYTPTSVTALSVACGYHQATGTMTAGPNNFFVVGDSTNSRGCEIRPNTPTSSQSSQLLYSSSSSGLISVGVIK